jgi:hypothetical protein
MVAGVCVFAGKRQMARTPSPAIVPAAAAMRLILFVRIFISAASIQFPEFA